LAEIERVNLTEFGDFSLKFLVSYCVTTSDTGKNLDTQSELNYPIKEAFKAEGIEMAFPTRTLYIRK
jgi:MscS family membrane protein